MIVILGYDGLEYNYVREFECKNLMQTSFGKTNISEFSEPRTVVLWSSFLAGRNTEREVLKNCGRFGESREWAKDLWNFRLNPEETLFSRFKKWKAIDVPGFNLYSERHAAERKALKDFFDGKITVEEYDEIAMENHRHNKEEFFDALDNDYEIIMGYFGLADVIGHLSFGIKSKMKLIYKELDEIARRVRQKISGMVLIVSDHGMRAVGRFGDHSDYGFWSLNRCITLNTPRITEFRRLIESFSVNF